MSERAEKELSRLTEEQQKVLADISREVHEIYKAGLYVEKEESPTMKFLAEKAIEDPEFPADKKAKIKELYDQGEFSKISTYTDPKITKKIEAELNRRIKLAIKKGFLPKKI